MYHVIVNLSSASGKSKKAYARILKELKKREVAYKSYHTKYAAHATEIATEICNIEDDDKRILICGGDGTINEVLNGITDFENVKIGVIPTGSGNDFVRGHGIKGTTEEIVDSILDNVTPKKVDIGVVKYDDKTRYFGISSGVGLDALVCKKALSSKLKKALNKVELGSKTYGLITAMCLFSMKYFGLKSTFDDEEREYNKAIFSAVMILPYEGGGVGMAPHADMTDGRLSICTAADVSKIKAVPAFIALLRGKHETHKAFTVRDTDEYKVLMDIPQVLHTDGEYIGEVCEASFSCKKEVLSLLNREG